MLSIFQTLFVAVFLQTSRQPRTREAPLCTLKGQSRKKWELVCCLAHFKALVQPASLLAAHAMGITGLLPLLKPVTKDIHVSSLKGLVSKDLN